MGILEHFIGNRCPRHKTCKGYNDLAPSCNEDYRKGYCGAERFQDENENNPEQMDDYGYKFKK